MKDLSYNRLMQYFTTCSSLKTPEGPQDNWLQSPSYNIGDAVVLNLEIDYEVSTCVKSKFPNCKDGISVYHKFTDNEDKNPMNDTNSVLGVQLPLDKSMLDRRHTVTVKVNVTAPRKSKMVIAFRDIGGCTTIFRVIVQYAFCPSVIRNLAIFPRTVVRNSNVQVKGMCNANASPQSSSGLRMSCHTNGKWYTPVGSCDCLAGFWPNSFMCEGKWKVLVWSDVVNA